MDDIELSLKRQEQVLTANRDFIIKQLDADEVIDELIQERLIGENAAQRIGLVTTSRVDKNRIILDQLSIAGPGALKKFCDILKKKMRQTFIAEKLERCLHSTTTESTSEPAQPVTVVQPSCVVDVKRLKSRYLRQLPTAKTGWPKHKVTKFVRLALIEKEDVTLKDENLNEVTKLTLQGDVDRILKKKVPLADLREIFHYENKPCPRLIVIMGGPGIGKTTLANEMCLRWARDGFLSEDFDVVALIPMRCVQQRPLQEVMIEYLRREVYEQVESIAGSRCLIILEGLDEMERRRQKSDRFFIGLVKECTVLEEATVMITSRPHACAQLNADRCVEVIGFGGNEVKEFINKSFPNDEHSASKLLKQLNGYPHLKSLSYVPLNLLMLVDIFQCQQNKELPSTLTELYKLFIVMMLQREIGKEDKKCSDVSPTAANSEDLKKMLPGIPINAIGTVFLLCRLSFCGFFNWHVDIKEEDEYGDEMKWKDPKIIFTTEDLEQCGIVVNNQFDGFGLLKATHIHEVPTDTSAYNFSHLSIQEFLSSLYISLLPQEEQLRLVNEHFHDFPNVFMFLSGLTRLQCNEMYHMMCSMLKSRCDVVLAVRCLYESICSVQSAVPSTLDMCKNDVVPYDCYCISYMISHYPVSQLKMARCFMGDNGAEILAKHYSSEKVTDSLLELLDLSLNHLTAVGMEHIMKIVMTSSTTLGELDVSFNDVGDNGISVITEWLLSNKLLRKLNVSYCDFSMKGASCLGELLKVNNSLQELDMGRNVIGDDGMSSVADGLQYNKSLTKLDIEWCGLSVKGAISISQALMVNQTLLELRMAGNQIGDDGIIAIAGSLSSSSIILLNVMECSISVVGARLIMKSAVDSAVCKHVIIDSNYNDDEVRRMMSILYDRSKQDTSNKHSSKDDDCSEEKSLEKLPQQQAATVDTYSSTKGWV